MKFLLVNYKAFKFNFFLVIKIYIRFLIGLIVKLLDLDFLNIVCNLILLGMILNSLELSYLADNMLIPRFKIIIMSVDKREVLLLYLDII